MTITSRKTIAAELVSQQANHPPGTPDEVIVQATADKLCITVDMVAKAIGLRNTRNEH